LKLIDLTDALRRDGSSRFPLPPTDNPFAAAFAATRMPMLVTDPGRADNPIIYGNQAFTQLTGYAREEILGTNCRFLQGPGTNLDDVAKVRKAIEDRQSIEIDLLNYCKDGTSFWNRSLVSPVFDAPGQLTHFFASQFDISPEPNRLAELAFEHGELEVEIVKRMQDMVMTEARLRFVLGAAGMATFDVTNNRATLSRQCLLNYSRNSLE
tara:strand:+ start:1054 stop:1683 length:630 start_codon:yes stop_codon:yes gene_type:complete